MRPRFLMLVIGVVLIIASIGAAIWYFNRGDSTESVPRGGVKVVEEAGVKFAKDVRETEYLSLDLSYPEPSIATAEITKYVEGLRDQYLAEYGSITTQAGQEYAGLFEGQKAMLNIATVLASSTQTKSYILEVYEFTGGAHGITSMHTFTYDTKNNLIDFDEYFIASSTPALLTKLSAAAFDYFTKTLGDDTTPDVLKEGTAARQENFAQWYPKGDSIVFIFGQYALGAYALGIQEFSVPRADLAQFVNPLYR